MVATFIYIPSTHFCCARIGQIFRLSVKFTQDRQHISYNHMTQTLTQLLLSYLPFNMAISDSTVVLTCDIVMLDVAEELWPTGVAVLLGVFKC